MSRFIGFPTRVAFLLVFLGGIAAGLAWAQGAAPDVQVITVEDRQKQRLVSVGGTVVAHKSVTLAAQVPGRVEYIAGKEGDRFREGAQLVVLDDDAYRAKLRAAEAQKMAALATLRNAGVQLDRELASPRTGSEGMGMPMMDQMMSPFQGMMGGGDRSKIDRRSEIIARQTTVEQARTSLMQARSQIEEIQAMIRDTRSVAPFNGVIIKKYVDKGDTVQPGQRLLDFADTQALQVQVDIPARLRPSLRLGMEVPTKLDVLDRTIPTRVARIFPVADPRRHTVRVKLDLPKGVEASAGTYAQVLISDPKSAARSSIVIPKSAIVWKGGLPLVFVVNEQDRAELHMIRVGDTTGDEVVVLSGLQPGERLVINPRPGMRSGEVIAP